ncbi:hypothetical protein DCAR_0102547 [Daucus carota subsp. sativus]|uniref:CASP-like protein n=1 Tax=Daucus carota subsp. sativus TaxID=79200 RepID=A0A169WQW2_DAUCS|nr:PREDICTED: CASP-like protein 1E2 [Daucus carota subsp. sativus]WOG83372.1 hypothetical protein DCAR_0102547 [Daucus carota subsp. sativus]
METEKISNGESKDVRVASKKSVRFSDLFLRLMALALTLAAAVTLGLSKQTAIVPITLVSTLPPMNVPVTAQWHDMSAFKYFVVTNAISCGYGALSLILAVANRGKRNGLAVLIIVLDILVLAVLASGIGAASAVGILGYNGNKHVHWEKVCHVFGKFCHQVAAAIVVSLLGSLAFLFLLVLSALDLQKKNYY